MTSPNFPYRFGAPAVLIGAMLLAACADGSSGPGGRNAVSLSFAAATQGSAGSSVASAAVIPVSDGRHTLDLDRVDLTVRRLELDRTHDFDEDSDVDTDEDSDRDSDRDGRDHAAFATGPLNIEVPMDGRLVTVLTEPIPPGRFDQVEIELRAVRFRGTFDRQPFDVTMRVNADVEIDLDPPFVVDEDVDRLNLTIELNAVRWLRERDGSLVDPRALETNDNVRARVRTRIVRSFLAFEDHDRDGKKRG